jgi:hypothetical protein
MTVVQKNKITEMRKRGTSYADIAAALKLPQGTVKSFCWRNDLSDSAVSVNAPRNVCRQCGTVLVQISDAPPKKFCSDKCRSLWWSNHRKPNSQAVCTYCKKKFEFYGNAKRKYCSRACFMKDHFGEETHE